MAFSPALAGLPAPSQPGASRRAQRRDRPPPPAPAAAAEEEAQRRKFERLKEISERISKVMEDCKGDKEARSRRPDKALMADRAPSTGFFWAPVPQGSAAPPHGVPARDAKHFVTGNRMCPPWPAGLEEATFGMGCFWCSENLYMKLPGVYSTQVGYAGGIIPNPSYAEVCTGLSKHNEVVRVVFDPRRVSYTKLLKIFWERHDPTTPNQQGGDMGTQYRSGIYYYTHAQRRAAEATKELFQKKLDQLRKGGARISTEILPVPEFFYAEEWHQQYDEKPESQPYCGLQPTGAKLDASDLQALQLGAEP